MRLDTNVVDETANGDVPVATPNVILLCVTLSVVRTFWSIAYNSLAPCPVFTVANVTASVVRTFWSIAYNSLAPCPVLTVANVTASVVLTFWSIK